MLVKLLELYSLKFEPHFEIGFVCLQLRLIGNLCLKSFANQIMQGFKITAFTKEISKVLSAFYINQKYSEKIMMRRQRLKGRMKNPFLGEISFHPFSKITGNVLNPDSQLKV